MKKKTRTFTEKEVNDLLQDCRAQYYRMGIKDGRNQIVDALKSLLEIKDCCCKC